jgi:hypothetical protein
MKIFEKLNSMKERCEVGISVSLLAISLFCLIVCLECVAMIVKHDIATLANVFFMGLLLSVNGLATFFNLTRLSNAIRARLRSYD